ncbi:hypothetical protein ES703_52968 [subsurface metagenome]
MHKHIGLFIEDDYIVVFVNDVQWDILGQNLFAGRFGDCQINFITRAQLKAGLDDFAVNLNGAFLDYALDETAAEF